MILEHRLRRTTPLSDSAFLPCTSSRSSCYLWPLGQLLDTVVHPLPQWNYDFSQKILFFSVTLSLFRTAPSISTADSGEQIHLSCENDSQQQVSRIYSLNQIPRELIGFILTLNLDPGLYCVWVCSSMIPAGKVSPGPESWNSEYIFLLQETSHACFQESLSLFLPCLTPCSLFLLSPSVFSSLLLFLSFP